MHQYSGQSRRSRFVMQPLLCMARAVDRVNRFVGRSAVWFILISVIISAVNAAARKALDVSSNAWLEVQWYLYGAAFLGAAGYVLLVDEHVRIDALAQYFAPRVRVWLDIAALVLFVLPLSGFLVYVGGQYAWQAYQTGEASYNAGGLIRWPVYLCIPAGFGLLGLQAVSETIKRAAFLLGMRARPGMTEADLPPFLSGAARPERSDRAI